MARKNFAISAVATAPSPATSGTSLVVAAGEGARFLQRDGSFKEIQAVIGPPNTTWTPANAEVVTITAVSTDTLTITRAQEGTTARTVVVGDRIAAAWTADMYDSPEIDTLMVGSGDLVIGYYNLTPSVVDVRKGTAAAPDLLPQPVGKVSRTVKLTRAVIEAAGASAAADGVDFAAAFAAHVVGTVDNEVQVVGLAGFASSTSTVDPGVAVGGDDSCGVYGVGWTKGSGTGAGIGGFLLGRRDNDVGRVCGCEIHAANYGTVDSAYDPAGNVPVKGIWLNCSGNADSAAGFVISNAFGRQFEVGIAFTAQVVGGKTGGVRVNSIRDDSHSITAYALNGSHTYGIDAMGGTFSGAPIRLPNNSGIKWRNAADSADMHAVYVNSSNTLNLGESTSQVTISNPIFAFVSTTAVSSMIDALSFRMNSSNTPLAGFGLAIPFALKSSTTNSQNAASLGVAWSDPTHATRTGYMRFDTVSNAGALAERARIDQTGLVIAAGHKLSTPALAIGTTSVAGQFARASGTDGTTVLEAIPFSRGGTILTPATGNNYMVWRAPFACTVTAVKAHYKGGTSVVINARRNQSSAHLASNLLVNTANAWADGGAVQNTAYAAGDDLEIQAITVTGAVTELAIQVDFTRP